jgi:hypothetical protein
MASSLEVKHTPQFSRYSYPLASFGYRELSMTVLFSVPGYLLSDCTSGGQRRCAGIVGHAGIDLTAAQFGTNVISMMKRPAL